MASSRRNTFSHPRKPPPMQALPFRSGSFSYFGMADLLPVEVPKEYTRAGNITHTGRCQPIPDGKKFSYGTAGFREKAELLPFIVYRAAHLAGLRARNQDAAIGLMITASHNPKEDNGVKIIDLEGQMLDRKWEKYATELVNASDTQLPTAVRALETTVKSAKSTSRARVLCAMDTRPSGAHLAAAAREGAGLLGVDFVNYGILTTPQLHYIVRCENFPDFGPKGERGYYQSMGNAFNEFVQLHPDCTEYSPDLHLDCANGVGARKMRTFLTHLDPKALNITFHNEDGELNHECGADYVKIKQQMPVGMEKESLSTNKCASFDGDADRLIYFVPRENGLASLLDGDKIAVLYAKFLCEQLHEAGLRSEIKIAVIQTAYANGSSTNYIKDVLKVPTVYVPTGVKYLHHEALKFDVGVYFEANGHGTVIFSGQFRKLVEHTENVAASRLNLFSRIVNETVGDAMADLLGVEAILRFYKWSIQDWLDKLYHDLPNRQLKVEVHDRFKFKPCEDETELLEPAGFQETINRLVADDGPSSRAFVRPSGTENIVRVYAESTTQEKADGLAKRIADAMKALNL